MKRRILSILMAICLVITLISVCSVYVSAVEESNNALFLSSTAITEEEYFEIIVTSNIEDGIAAMAFTPDFDFSAFELTEVECLISEGSFLYNEDPLNPKFLWYNTSNVTFEQGTELFILKFYSKTGAREDTYPISLRFNCNDICDENGSYIPLRVEAGEATIFRFLVADVDNNFSIDSADVVKLARYLVYMETEINTYGADVNKDGYVDTRDLIKLSRYLIGKENIDGIVYR